MISFQANAESRYYEHLMTEETPFDECVDAMTNGIEMFNNLAEPLGQWSEVEKVFFWRNGLYKVFYLQNIEFNGLHKIYCYRLDETKRRK